MKLEWICHAIKIRDEFVFGNMRQKSGSKRSFIYSFTGVFNITVHIVASCRMKTLDDVRSGER